VPQAGKLLVSSRAQQHIARVHPSLARWLEFGCTDGDEVRAGWGGISNVTLRNQVLSTFGANAAQLVLGVATSILIARWLGPAGRGEVAAALLWPALLIYGGSLGLFSAATYLIARPGADVHHVSATGLMLGLLHGCVACGAALLIIPIALARQSSEVINAARILIAVIPLSMIGMCGTNLLLGRMRINTVNVLRCLVPLGYFIGVVSIRVCDVLNVTNLAMLYLGLNVLFAASSVITLWRCNLVSGLRLNLQVAREYWSYGSKIHVGSLGALANQNLAQLILASYAAPAALGIYVVASNTAGAIQILGQAVQSVALPTIASAPDNGRRIAALQHIFGRFWNVNLIALPIAAILLPPAMLITYGRGFSGAIIPAEILLLGFVLLTARDVLIAGAQALGRPFLGSGVYWIGAVVTAALLLILMPRFGIIGAAIAGLASAIVQLVATLIALRRSEDLSIRALFRVDLSDARSLAADVVNRVRIATRT
jgi:O-antigen/teichoic acid export membrane protein